MIVDTSAIMALLLNEPEHVEFAHAMAVARTRRLSAGSWIELAAVLSRHPHGDKLGTSLDDIIRDTYVTIEAVTVEQARIGHAAYREYGRGSKHAADLNFGDCFAYALAKSTGLPLLTLDADFRKSDIAVLSP